MQLNPYLFFNGQCEAAFKFYEKCLDGKITAMLPHEGTPAAGQVSSDWQKKILHARIVIGDRVLMASDAPPDRYHGTRGFSVSVGAGSPEEADRIFQALSENGTVQMPIQKTFFSARFGMLTDQFGIPWMINCGQPG